MRDEIIRAREILEQTNDTPRAERPLDPIARWKRDGDALLLDRARAKEELREQELELERKTTDGWIAYFERRLVEERQLVVESAGEALGRVRAALRKEIAELRAELKMLESDVKPKRRDPA
jgi:hypothetical protein